MALLRLPEELLIQIFSCLCIHCQNPCGFPNADEPGVREDNTALVSLCLTSKQILAFAQPILYHHYATGNIPPPSFTPRAGSYEYIYLSDSLPAFLSTIIRRPSLATHIRCLQLQEIEPHYHPSTLTPQVIRLLYDTSNAIGIETPFATEHVLDRILQGKEDISDLRSRIKLHQWLRALAITLTPHTKKLIYGENPRCVSTYNSLPDQPLPTLTSLKFNNATRGCTFGMLQSLLRKAPNLTLLHLTDYANTRTDRLPENVSLALPKLTRLVGEGAEIEIFRMVLGWCEEVRVVEYYCNRFLSEKGLLRALSPVKGVLRRLCYMDISGGPSRCGIDTPSEPILGIRFNSGIIRSLKEFCQLEELVIDQWAFRYHDDFDEDSKRLIALLPESIQSVHFRYVYKSMMEELQQLALAVPHSFPKLRSLKISVVDKWRVKHPTDERKRVERLRQMRSVETDFADVDVQVEWDVEGATRVQTGGP
ncbi:hypothetical protein V492_05787 [Pseudogymnoascus sp. VKM F-4246]|nr:hypothetical protein V492_05787 [Pseudogymnoascus sp. VKM F-4246]